MGTRGKEVARSLADRLESRLVYHELINDPPDPEDLTGPSEVKRHLGNGANAPTRPNGTSGPGGQMTAVELLELASRGNVIIRGWGAVRLLHAIPHVFCLRICAPMEDRIAEMVRRLGVSERAARREIERSDALHSNVFQRLFSGDWREAVNYDLVLNTARLTTADCADLIVEAFARPAFAETEASRQELADRLAQARITAFLASAPDLGRLAGNVYASVSGGAVTLYGTVHRRGAAAGIEAAVRAHTQCERIENTIRQLGYMEG